jgi:hypothetical protein
LKNLPIKLSILFLIFLFSGSCKKDKTTIVNREISINNLKQYYSNYLEKNISKNFLSIVKPKWETLAKSQDGDLTIFEVICDNPFKIINTKSGATHNSYDKEVNSNQTAIKLLLFSREGNIIDGSYMVLNGTSANLNETKYKHLNGFEGSLMYYDLESHFSNGYKYQGGKIISEVNLAPENASVSLKNGIQLGSNGSYGSSGKTMAISIDCTVSTWDVYLEYCPVNVVATVTASSTSSKNKLMSVNTAKGLASPGGSCEWVWIDSYETISCTVSGSDGGTPVGGGSSNGTDSSAWPGDLDCSSFVFTPLGTSNTMTAIVTNLKSPSFGTFGQADYKSFPLRTIVVDAPIRKYDGTEVTPGEAAEAAAEAANAAVQALGLIYGVSGKWKTAMESTYERDFITTMDTYFRATIGGGRVSIYSGSRPGITPHSAKYSGFLDGLFGSGCN